VYRYLSDETCMHSLFQRLTGGGSGINLAETRRGRVPARVVVG
jgi:hypothetical protein